MAAVAYMDTPGPVVAPTEVPTVTPTVVRAVSPAVASDVASVVVPVDTELPITLECSLCPKKPKFSDSSHLLTHISSKAHLHQKFSTELKAKSDAAASDRLEKYEKWYSVNGIELLLAERLSTKSRGKAAPRRSRAAATPKAKPRKSASAVNFIKKDVDAESAYRTPDHLPPLAHWNTVPVGRDTGYPAVQESHYLNGTLYNTPASTTQRAGSYAAYPGETGGNGTHMKPGKFGAHPGTAPPSDVGSAFSVSFTDEDAQGNKLKGIIWPGMDLFDSATPDQKRKRNQRKDDAAIDLLKGTSQNVTATEQVWGPSGDIRKERDIYASPSSVEGTPPSTPPPRKRKSRARNSASSALTPLAVLKTEDGQDGPPTKQRRASGARASAKGRSTRASTRTTDKATDKANNEKTTGVRETSAEIEEAVYALGNHKPRSAFNVYYEGSTHGTAVDPQSALTDGTHGNSFDQVLHSRPALQQLDANLSIAEGSPYFKHSTSSNHFFNNGRQSPHLPPYHSTQPPSYGNVYQGMNNNTVNPLCTQPRSGSSMYPPFDNHMFSGNGGSATDGTAGSFHAADNRRIGYSGFSMDPTGSPFGYNDSRDGSLRDTNYTDPTFQSAGRLFEL